MSLMFDKKDLYTVVFLISDILKIFTVLFTRCKLM